MEDFRPPFSPFRATGDARRARRLPVRALGSDKKRFELWFKGRYLSSSSKLDEDGEQERLDGANTVLRVLLIVLELAMPRGSGAAEAARREP